MKYCPDTTVLLRLQDIGALQVLGQLKDCEIILTDVVWTEATCKPTIGPAAAKILSGIASVKQHRFLPNTDETRLFAKLRQHYPESKYQDGELLVIALAASDPGLVPVVVERRGLVAACDELRRTVLTGHWFFGALQQQHDLPSKVFKDCVALLNSKSYPTPTWALT